MSFDYYVVCSYLFFLQCIGVDGRTRAHAHPILIIAASQDSISILKRGRSGFSTYFFFFQIMFYNYTASLPLQIINKTECKANASAYIDFPEGLYTKSKSMPCILLVFNCKAICNLIKVICTRQFQPYSHTHTYHVCTMCMRTSSPLVMQIPFICLVLRNFAWLAVWLRSLYLFTLYICTHTRNSLFERWWCRHDKFFISWALDNINKNPWQKQIRRKGKKQRNEMNFFAERIEMNNFKSQPFVNCRRCILNMCDEFYSFACMTNSNGYIFSFVCILQIHWCLFSGFLFSSCTEPFETR